MVLHFIVFRIAEGHRHDYKSLPQYTNMVRSFLLNFIHPLYISFFLFFLSICLSLSLSLSFYDLRSRSLQRLCFDFGSCFLFFIDNDDDDNDDDDDEDNHTSA